MKFIGIIPARYSSTRFPGKPLALLGGKPVVQHVYEKATVALDTVYVATDDNRIYEAVKAFGGKAVMTRADHKNGTERIREAIREDWRGVGCSRQYPGDEPFIHPTQIEALCHCFDDSQTDIAAGQTF